LQFCLTILRFSIIRTANAVMKLSQ
jgi:hypothetical protein